MLSFLTIQFIRSKPENFNIFCLIFLVSHINPFLNKNFLQKHFMCLNYHLFWIQLKFMNSETFFFTSDDICIILKNFYFNLNAELIIIRIFSICCWISSKKTLNFAWLYLFSKKKFRSSQHTLFKFFIYCISYILWINVLNKLYQIQKIVVMVCEKWSFWNSQFHVNSLVFTFFNKKNIYFLYG